MVGPEWWAGRTGLQALKDRVDWSKQRRGGGGGGSGGGRKN